MKFRISILWLMLCASTALFTPTQLLAQKEGPTIGSGQQPNIVEFDVKGASTLPGLGTFAVANNFQGAITGYWADASSVSHGFLRSPNGTITSFEATGASTAAGSAGTVPTSINDLGAIAGEYQDANGLYHGFVRFPNGFFQTIDAPGAGASANQGTFPLNINLLGVTAGVFVDANNVERGFIDFAYMR